MRQSTSSILMVRPANFGFNPETAANNAFQKDDGSMSASSIAQKAQIEFDRMSEDLLSKGVELIIIEDTKLPIKTDAVFPNNWFSTHEDGRLFVYPMYSANRRLERREDILSRLIGEYGFQKYDDLLAEEDRHIFLEGTGSMILDRCNGLIYACYSERTHPKLLRKMAMLLGYELIGFDAEDVNGVPYYHTNVIMALGKSVSIICLECIEDEKQAHRVKKSLQDTNKAIVEISRIQVEQFAGNMLEVLGSAEKPLLVMSTNAYNSLNYNQLDIINKHNIICHYDLDTIEKYGGGSARCMMAEIFFPK